MRSVGRIPVVSFEHPESTEEHVSWVAMTAIAIPKCTYNPRSGPDSGWPTYIIEARPISAKGPSREQAVKNLRFAVEEAFKALKDAQTDEIVV